MLVVATSLSNHPNDQLDALPTVDEIDPRLGQPKRAALDNGYFSITNIEGLQSRGIEPYIPHSALPTGTLGIKNEGMGITAIFGQQCKAEQRNIWCNVSIT